MKEINVAILGITVAVLLVMAIIQFVRLTWAAFQEDWRAFLRSFWR